ncbi:hypothetical protein P1P68_22065 [Streptomyces scabiei]|uniref:hypothetical protein n=1 Tax=Streptomyces scabiei TaxID=1930 RepID=UPI00298F762A|nr:hypothetical protein [Streptomyces scabiei]MDW8807399.1 hypothetical protein [Streptomyces scabiei]
MVIVAVGILAPPLAAALPAGGPLTSGPGTGVTLLRVTTLGLLAAVVLGAAIGAVLPSSREALALIMLSATGLPLTSGTVFAITARPVRPRPRGRPRALTSVAELGPPVHRVGDPLQVDDSERPRLSTGALAYFPCPTCLTSRGRAPSRSA